MVRLNLRIYKVILTGEERKAVLRFINKKIDKHKIDLRTDGFLYDAYRNILETQPEEK